MSLWCALALAVAPDPADGEARCSRSRRCRCARRRCTASGRSRRRWPPGAAGRRERCGSCGSSGARPTPRRPAAAPAVSPHSDGSALPILTPPAPRSNSSQPSTRLCWQPGPKATAYSPVWRTAQFSITTLRVADRRDGGPQVDLGLRKRLALGRRGPVRVGERQAAQLNVLDPTPLREVAGQQDQVPQPRRDDDRLLRVFARLGQVGRAVRSAGPSTTRPARSEPRGR